MKFRSSIRDLFRFSIRDVLWLTLVVALALGWWIDGQRLSAEALRTKIAYSERAYKWRGRTAALERNLGYLGWKVTWKGDIVIVGPQDGQSGRSFHTSTRNFQPSIQDD